MINDRFWSSHLCRQTIYFRKFPQQVHVQSKHISINGSESHAKVFFSNLSFLDQFCCVWWWSKWSKNTLCCLFYILDFFTQRLIQIDHFVSDNVHYYLWNLKKKSTFSMEKWLSFVPEDEHLFKRGISIYLLSFIQFKWNFWIFLMASKRIEIIIDNNWSASLYAFELDAILT